jgi:glutamine amidotransferase
MCRLFGFRSVIPSQVHRSLLAAENALGTQSNAHPDGWGVAFYVDGAPHVTRNPLTALGDKLFHRLSGVVSSETVVAHVRKATRGENSVLNCHPFQYGRWVFAHNGDIPEFESFRDSLIAEVSPSLRRFILGDTDSEVVFFILMTQLLSSGALAEERSAEDVAAAWQRTEAIVRGICERPGLEPCLLTILVSDGATLVAAHGGKDLYWSSYKNRCSDRARCPSLSPECEAPSQSGLVNHCIISSEPLQGENVWIPLEPGQVVGVDARMRLLKANRGRRPLPMTA